MEEGFQTYHVFINHRGPDVKKTLASLIYHALIRFRLRVFLDEEELQTGDSLTPAIMTAIRSASVHIAIFSKNYAKSAWCLNELLWMLDCQGGSKLIPIFYDVQPSDLHYIHKGAYSEAFHGHRSKGRVGIPVVERWINALNKVSQISGLVFSNGQGQLGEFLERIVDAVLKYVRTEPLDVALHPVGLDQAEDDFINGIFYHSVESTNTMVVGIVGLGGSGKSTLVKHLYNSARSEFRRSCFLSDVRKTHLPSLQLQLLNDLLGYQRYLNIENTSKGRSLLRDRLKGFPRVLIVFDDIDDAEQMENLLLVKDVLGIGSLILVTSRDRDLLARSQINILYPVKLLHGKDAQELFCQHAFHQHKPHKYFEDLVAELIIICGGFPLALKVLGGMLSGNSDRSYWKRQIDNLKTQMPEEILQKVLKDTTVKIEDLRIRVKGLKSLRKIFQTAKSPTENGTSLEDTTPKLDGQECNNDSSSQDTLPRISSSSYFLPTQTYSQSLTIRLEEKRVNRCDTEQWMHHRWLPEDLRNCVRRYDQYKWLESRRVDEEHLVQSLPKDLRHGIKWHLYLGLVRRVPLFESMDDRLLDALCECFKPSLYTEDTYIVREGDPIEEMLFIIRGYLDGVTTNGGRTGFFNRGLLKQADFCGEELLTWALDPKSGVNLPSSTRTVKASSEVEGFALRAEDLKFVASQVRCLHSRQVQHTFRFYSQQWRTWSARYIQAAWHRYCKRKRVGRTWAACFIQAAWHRYCKRKRVGRTWAACFIQAAWRHHCKKEGC